MEWRDEGIVLCARPYGEHGAMIEVFTACHGRHKGMVQGGSRPKMAAILQPGTQLSLIWQARLEEQLGTFRPELLQSCGKFLADPMALAVVQSLCALLHETLPERQPHEHLYQQTQFLLGGFAGPDDQARAYVHWELSLLEELGYGLDLRRCAVSGDYDDLAYVSPKTGRAISRQAAGEWAARLFPLPPAMLGQGGFSGDELRQAFHITGYFLEKAFMSCHPDMKLPMARARLVDICYDRLNKT